MTRLLPWLVIALVALFRASRLLRRRGSRPARRVGFPAIRGNEVMLIAAREMRQRARGRAFRVVSVLMLVAVAAAVVIPTLTGGGQAHERVGMVNVPADGQSLIFA